MSRRFSETPISFKDFGKKNGAETREPDNEAIADEIAKQARAKCAWCGKQIVGSMEELTEHAENCHAAG